LCQPGPLLACCAARSPSQRRSCLGPSCPVFSKDPTTTEIYTLSLHDALPILPKFAICKSVHFCTMLWLFLLYFTIFPRKNRYVLDRKSTRLNSSHVKISYAVFCLKKKEEGAVPQGGTRTRTRSMRRERSPQRV